MDLRSGRVYSKEEGIALRSGRRLPEIESEPIVFSNENIEGMELRSGRRLATIETNVEERPEEDDEEETEEGGMKLRSGRIVQHMELSNNLSDVELGTIMLMLIPKHISTEFYGKAFTVEEAQQFAIRQGLSRQEIIIGIKANLRDNGFTDIPVEEQEEVECFLRRQVSFKE